MHLLPYGGSKFPPQLEKFVSLVFHKGLTQTIQDHNNTETPQTQAYLAIETFVSVVRDNPNLAKLLELPVDTVVSCFEKGGAWCLLLLLCLVFLLCTFLKISHKLNAHTHILLLTSTHTCLLINTQHTHTNTNLTNTHTLAY